MGTISKLENGKYKTTVYDVHGARHRKTFIKKAEADAFVAKVEAAKNDLRLTNNHLKKARYLIEHELENFMATKTDLRPKTIRKYENFSKQFKLFCNALKINYIDEFTPEVANIFLRELTGTKLDPKGSTDRMLRAKPRTVNYYLRVARSFFDNQLLLDHIEKNPMHAINNLRVEKDPPEYYSQTEIESFFAQEMHEAYRNAFQVLLHTGLRFGELASLTWDDIDLNKRLIYVRPKDDFKTKTYCSIRSVPINNVVYNILSNLAPGKQSRNPVLCSVKGHKLRERILYHVCNKIGKKAGVHGKISLHKFRHTFATQLVQNNVRIEVVQKLLGHSSIKETMIYAHIRPDNLHDDVNVLERLFGNVNHGPNLGTGGKKV